MSVSKYKSNNFKGGLQSRDKGEDNGGSTSSSIISERIRRIDGSQQIKKYMKCGLLGKGGFANCYITENMETKTKAATKVVIKDELRTHRTRLRLANEIKLHKTLHHPNVVQLYHCFEDRDNVYIFLELCENQSLNELLRIRGTFLTPEIQSFLFGIVNGLLYIHKQKIIHRDLKLGNIFVDGKLNIKIGDFGLATKLEFRRQCKRTVCGTPNYIAPEVLDGRGYHFEVDVWSVGVILYTLYFGIPPFETEEANSTYQKIKDCDYLIPKTINTPHEAITLIQKILVRNPAQRLTLQQILQSDFMKLGQGVLKELPLVCSKKAPTKKQLNSSLPLTAGQHPKVNSSQKVNLNKEYVQQFQEVLEDTFYYKLANGQTGLIEIDIRIVYRRNNGKYFIKSLSNDYQEEAGETCQLKYLLMAKDNHFNVLDQLQIKEKEEKYTFVRKVKKIGDSEGMINGNIQIARGWLLKLSNNAFQLFLEDRSYLIAQNRLFELTPQKQKQISLSKLKGGTLKGNPEDLKLLLKIVTELQKQTATESQNSEKSQKSEKEIEKIESIPTPGANKENCKTSMY